MPHLTHEKLAKTFAFEVVLDLDLHETSDGGVGATQFFMLGEPPLLG
jgi:hypothetical protein